MTRSGALTRARLELDGYHIAKAHGVENGAFRVLNLHAVVGYEVRGYRHQAAALLE